MRYLIILLLLIGCKDVQSTFLNDFMDVTKSDIEKNLLNPVQKDGKIIEDSEKDRFLNNFLIPINSAEFKTNYSPKNENIYIMYYKYQVNKNTYLVSIIEKYGYLTEYNQYLGLYDIDENRVKSILIIYTSDTFKKVTSTFKDNEIIVKSVYKNNLGKGLDLNPDNDNSITIIEKYKFDDYFKRLD